MATGSAPEVFVHRQPLNTPQHILQRTPQPVRRLARLAGMLLLLLAGGSASADGSDSHSVLIASKAFGLDIGTASGGIALHFRVAPGYYLYQDSFRFEAISPKLELTPGFPRDGDWKDDAFRGRTRVYTRDVDVVLKTRGDGTVRISWQGCADAGVCYPPQSDIFSLKNGAVLGAPVTSSGVLPAPADNAATAGPAAPATLEFRAVRSVNELQRALKQASQNHKTAMLSLSSEGESCQDCRTMQNKIYSDPRVIQRLSGLVLLQANMIPNDQDSQDLFGYFGAFSPPQELFFVNGQELTPQRVDRMTTLDEFLSVLESVSPEKKADRK
jgi:thiol:disulfide interchange protein